VQTHGRKDEPPSNFSLGGHGRQRKRHLDGMPANDRRDLLVRHDGGRLEANIVAPGFRNVVAASWDDVERSNWALLLHGVFLCWRGQISPRRSETAKDGRRCAERQRPSIPTGSVVQVVGGEVTCKTCAATASSLGTTLLAIS